MLFYFLHITAQYIAEHHPGKRPQTSLMPPRARPQRRSIKTYFHLSRKPQRSSLIQRLFWPAGGRDRSLLQFESPKLLQHRQLSLMSVVELRLAWGYQSVTEHHTLSPPLPSLLTLQRPWLLFFPGRTNSLSHATCHTETKKQH